MKLVNCIVGSKKRRALYELSERLRRKAYRSIMIAEKLSGLPVGFAQVINNMAVYHRGGAYAIEGRSVANSIAEAVTMLSD